MQGKSQPAADQKWEGMMVGGDEGPSERVLDGDKHGDGLGHSKPRSGYRMCWLSSDGIAGGMQPGSEESHIHST